MQNLLLITIDCLRADRLGDGRIRNGLSPNIDKLAAQSAVFRHAYVSGPRTAESFPGILTSTYPLQFGGAWKLPDDLLSLAQVLQRAGYATAAFHSNPFLSANLGYDRGFDTFWDSSDQTPVTSKVGARVMPLINTNSALYKTLRRLVRQVEAGAGLSHYVAAEKVTNMALGWMAQQDAPFFLWIHYMDMHYPYAPPQELLQQLHPDGVGKRKQVDLLVRSLENPQTLTGEETQMLQALYDAGLLYIDGQVGLLLQALNARGDDDDTVVIVTGDHGEEFLEHGQFGHGGLIHLRDGDRARIRLYDELLHVPLILHTPHLAYEARTIDALVSLVDIPPTAVALLGLPAAQSWQGKSLAPLLEGTEAPLHPGVFSEYALREEEKRYPIVAYRTEEWKYIHDGAFGNHELYDLNQDPQEQVNLYHPDHHAIPELQAAVLKHIEMAKAGSYVLQEESMDAEVVERLIGLGYLE